MKSNRHLRPFILLALLLAPVGSRAAVVIDNLTPGNQGFAASLSGPTAAFFFGGTFEDRQVAFSFTTGPDWVSLTGLTFSTNVGDPDLSPIQATLSTGSAVPGGQDAVTIGTVAPVSDTPISQVPSITPAAPIALDPGSTYWVHLTVPAGGAIYTLNNTNSQVIAPGWALGNTWYYSPDESWSEITSGPQARIRLSVAPIPEPASALLVALGGLVILRRRR